MSHCASIGLPAGLLMQCLCNLHPTIVPAWQGLLMWQGAHLKLTREWKPSGKM